jgi:hypothetical protein
VKNLVEATIEPATQQIKIKIGVYIKDAIHVDGQDTGMEQAWFLLIKGGTVEPETAIQASRAVSQVG